MKKTQYTYILLLLVLASTAFASGQIPRPEPNNLPPDLLAQDDEPPPPPPPMDEEPPPPPPIDENPPMPDDSGSSYSPPSSPAPSRRNEAPVGKEAEEAAAAEKALRYKNPPIVKPTEKEKKVNCAKYNNQFISFHEDVYLIRNCKKYLLSAEEAGKLSSKLQPRDVPSGVLASIPEGGEYAALDRRVIRCDKFNKNYVTYNLKLFWVENCKLREFPDNATMQDHRWKNKYFDKPVIVLEQDQFRQFKFGEIFKSILNADYHNVKEGELTRTSNIKACNNVGKVHYVSYLDSIYKINAMKKGKGGCWREKVDAAELSRKMSLANLRELTAEQSLAIPDHDMSVAK